MLITKDRLIKYDNETKITKDKIELSNENFGYVGCPRCGSIDLELVCSGITFKKVMVDFVCNDCDCFFGEETDIDYVEFFNHDMDIVVNQ